MVHRKVIDNYKRERSAFPFIIHISLAKFFLHVETRTSLAGELVVPVDSSLGIFLLQLFDEGFHGSLLLGRTGVFRLAVLRQTADVADTDAYKIVTSAVGAYFFYRTAHVDAAVTINYKMIADAEKATISMPAVDVGYGVITTFLGRATMNDDFLDFTHDEDKFEY